MRARKELILQEKSSLKPYLDKPLQKKCPETPLQRNDKESICSSRKSTQRTHRSHRSQISNRSDVSSTYLRTKVKAEAAKVRLEFAEKEALIEREAAEKHAQLKIIKTEREYTEAAAELRVMDEYFQENQSSPSIDVPSEELSSHHKVEQFLDNHMPLNPTPLHYVQTPRPNPNLRNKLVPTVSSLNDFPHNERSIPSLRPQAPEFTPCYIPPPDMFADHDTPNETQQNHQRSVYRNDKGPNSNDPIEPHTPASKYQEYCNPVNGTPLGDNTLKDISRSLMKKDLLLHRLSSFNDKAETYLTWKASFKNITEDMNLSADEEIDLLVKYLGADSRRHAESLRIANATNPNLALTKIWSRLEQRYGAPELVELSLRQKLVAMPKIASNDSKRLYELADLLGEIQSIKEQDSYRSLMAFYDSSAGVNPIVAKLPTYLQNKWTAHASKYKKQKGVLYPPFSTFVDYICDQAFRANAPSFDYSMKPENKTTVIPEKKKNPPTSYQSKTITVHKTEVSQKAEVLCPLHNTSHSLNDCKAFQKKPIEERKKFMKTKGICFRCCAVNSHIAKDCTESSVTCQKCQSKRHCTALHCTEAMSASISTTAAKPTSSTEVHTNCTTVNCEEFSGRSCAKIVLIKVYHRTSPEDSKYFYAIVDDQSNKTLATSEFFDCFCEKGTEIEYTLSSCAGAFTMSGRRAGGYVAESVDGHTKMDLPSLIECNDIPNNKEEIPIPDIAEHYSHLLDIASQIPCLHDDVPISILIGRDMIDAHRVLDQRLGPKNTPFAQKLGLGWILIGQPCGGETHGSNVINVNKTRLLVNGRASVFKPCSNFFKAKETAQLENCLFERTIEDESRGLSIEDHQFLNIMDKEMTKNENGHWEAPLPLRPQHQALPNNRNEAMKRAKSLTASLRKNTRKKDHFVQFMAKILEKGHAELAPNTNPTKERWYLPIFGIYHAKKPDSLRVVFDSSAKYQGVSLNDSLLKGPDLANSLLAILMRFRREPIAFMADIQQMFHCFYVKEDDRDLLRFLWHKDNDLDEDIVEYRMKVHTFGNSPSPAIATYGLRKAADSVKKEHGEDVSDFVRENFYVDDGLLSLPDAKSATDILKRTQKALWEGGRLRLHKISSNSPELMKSFPSEDLAENLKDLSSLTDNAPLQRSLGIFWNVTLDSFTCKVSDEEKPFTKRGVLSSIGGLYDPLGLLAPITIKGKMFFRHIMDLTISWDDPLPSNLEKEWLQWRSSLKDLEALNIPRCYGTGVTGTLTKELHVFSDASSEAVAAAAFMRSFTQDGKIEVSFLLGKANLAPSGGQTIPRLELCAAVLATQLKNTVIANLGIDFDKVRMYTDSQIVLGYICNSARRFYVYVANRVQKIRSSTEPEQWTYVNTNVNPADDGTRSIPAYKLSKSLWLNGPKFLHQNSDEITTDEKGTFPLVNPESDKDVRLEIQVAKGSVTLNQPFNLTSLFEKYSEWDSLLRSFSYLIHLARSFKQPRKSCNGWHQCSKHKESNFKEEAKRLILIHVQRNHFSKEIKRLQAGNSLPRDSPILTLTPYLDEDGLLRVGGRLNKITESTALVEPNPLIIPKGCHVGLLIVRHCHQKVQHQGRHLTEGAVRSSGYWIVGGKGLVSSCIRVCVTCRKLRGTMGTQKMADLPVSRITPSAPFTYVGVDVFGPWHVITRRTRGGAANSKRWAALFTCLSTRAVHIEILEDMSSSSFINALRRFTSTRGDVCQFHSDRGTNFVGSTDHLKIDAFNVEDGVIKEHLYQTGVTWVFNSPHSSHMGGVWERMIGMARRILDSMLLQPKNKCLTHDVLSTLMYEVAAIINSRPIAQVSSDPEHPSILTPSALLTLKVGTPHEPFGDLTLKDMYKAQWCAVQVLANDFWKRFSREYLDQLQIRQKWQHTSDNLKPDDVILLKDACVHRRQWPIGRVVKTFPSSDGLVRKVEVMIIRKDNRTTFVRPVSELVYLFSVS
ncbi:uncharacterized protein [Argopecten irradians]|uniref:uncharacterized protein n=1 Tax=Argopecten irradians TaxID=31199 RepID=UPI00371E05C2